MADQDAQVREIGGDLVQGRRRCGAQQDAGHVGRQARGDEERQVMVAAQGVQRIVAGIVQSAMGHGRFDGCPQAAPFGKSLPHGLVGPHPLVRIIVVDADEKVGEGRYAGIHKPIGGRAGIGAFDIPARDKGLADAKRGQLGRTGRKGLGGLPVEVREFDILRVDRVAGKGRHPFGRIGSVSAIDDVHGHFSLLEETDHLPVGHEYQGDEEREGHHSDGESAHDVAQGDGAAHEGVHR